MNIFTLEWLVDQAPVILVMGTWITTMYYERREAKKERVIKDKQLYTLAEKVLTVASLWDTKSDLNSKEHRDIQVKIDDVRDDVREIKATIKTNV